MRDVLAELVSLGPLRGNVRIAVLVGRRGGFVSFGVAAVVATLIAMITVVLNGIESL